MSPNELFNLLEPQVWATYIVGFSAIGVGLWQFKRTYKLNKKSSVFDDLSKDIQDARDLVSKISEVTDSLINKLAEAANSADYDSAGKTPDENIKEIDRRLKDLSETGKEHKKYLDTIYGSITKMLLLIQKVEKSTIVNEKSRRAARYLYYVATDQHQLVGSVSSVLQTFKVIPSLGDKPNISSETFNETKKLIGIINQQNQVIGTYLEDLEIVIHNDLVKRIYKKARYSSIPVKHLTPSGLIDSRVEDSLL